jgi:xanthine dehydrogenase small subunit
VVIEFICNSENIQLDIPGGCRALDVIRENIGFTGCREGCGEGECGACTILSGELDGEGISYKAMVSCLMPAAELQGRHIVSIEGVSASNLNPVQQAFADTHASQCGFCTPGFILSVHGFLLTSKALSVQDGIEAIDGNICRCTGYGPIKRAIEKLSKTYSCKITDGKDRLHQLVNLGVLPKYFLDIPARLKVIENRNSVKKNLPVSENSNAVVHRKIISGGTDLYVQQGKLLNKNDDIICLQSTKEYSHITIENRMANIGAAASVEDIRLHSGLNKLIPGLKDDLLLVSSTILRNRASLGGNIVNASPIADLVIYFLPFRPELELEFDENNNARRARRTIKLADFFLDYKKTDLQSEKAELIRELSFVVHENAAFSFRKSSRRKYLDIASVNTGFYCEAEQGIIRDLVISAGGLGPVPLCFDTECHEYKGEKINKTLVKKISASLSDYLKPIDDIRGSSTYKKIIFTHQLFDHFSSAFPEYLNLEELAGEL